MYYQISLEGYQIICVRSFSFAKGQQAFENIYKQVSIQSGSPKKEQLLIWNSETTQNLNIYLYNYQTETVTFLATKHEKTIMICSYLIFFKHFLHFELLTSNTIKIKVYIHLNSWYRSHKKQRDGLETQVVLGISRRYFSLELEIFVVAVQRIHQTAKNGTFCEELLGENDLEAVLVNFCCYDYGNNASEAVQKISTRTLGLYANSLKQLIL